MSTSGTATLERPTDGQPPDPVEGEQPVTTPTDGEQPTPAVAEGAHDYDSMEEFAARLSEGLGGTPPERQPARISEERAREMGHGPLVLVNLDQQYDAETKAKDAASAQLTRELNAEAGFIKKHVRNIWKGNWFKGHYQRKYEAEKLKVIEETGNLYAFDGVSEDVAKESTAATITRFITPYEEMIHEGETRTIQNKDGAYATGIKKLLTRYADKTVEAGQRLDDAGLEQAVEDFETQYYIDHPEENPGTGNVRANNMMDIAKAVKGRMEYGESLEFLLANMRFMTGETRTTVRTEAAYDKLDQTVHNYLNSKFGRIVGEKTVSIGASAAIALFKMGRGSALTTIGLVGAGAGVSGYLRERKRMTDDRVEHTRQMAAGGEYEPGSKRREELEATRLETVPSVDLRNELDAAFNPARLAAGGPDALRAAIKKLAEIEARIQYSDHNKVDLISYSSSSAIERERLELDLTRARKKVFLRNHLANGAGQTLGQPGATTESLLAPEIESFTEERDQEQSDKDQLFKQVRHRRALKMGIAAAGTSLILAGAGSYVATTLLEGSAFGSGSVTPSSQFNTSHFGPHGTMEMSADHQIIAHTGPNGGTIDIADANGNVDPALAGLKVDANGNLDRSAWDALNSKGFNVQDVSPPDVVNPPITGNTHDFVAAHQGDMRTLNISWEDNNTPSVYDFNEQGGRLSYNPDGTVNVGESMTSGGSFNGEGGIDMTNSSENTFDFAFKQPDGSFIHKTFPYGAPLPKEYSDMLYQKPDGNWGFKGDGHVSWGKLDGDTFYSAASVPGDNTELTWPGGTTHVVDTKITGPTVEGNGAHLVAAPPITERKSLEDIKEKAPEPAPTPTPEPTPYMPDYMGDKDAAEKRRRREDDRIPALRDNPDAKIGLADGLAWHTDHLRDLDPAYTAEIERLVESTPELANIGPETKAVVTIPVGAKTEAENIHRTISLYAKQGAEAMADTLLLLHVNWKDVDSRDPNVIKTRREIERARRDFPDLRISVIESVWEQEKLANGEYGDRIIGHVSQKMYDSAMFAVKRAIDQGRMPTDSDMLVIKNDADAIGMDRLYLAKMIKSYQEHPESDTFTGGIRMETARFGHLPGFGFATNFWQIARIASQLERTGGSIDSFGVNTAVRMSTFAAVGGIGHYTNQSTSDPDDLAINYRVDEARGGDAAGGAYGATGTGRAQKHHRHVVGATIDTDAARMEEVYVDGHPITATWDKATKRNGEMSSRDSGDKKAVREDLRSNPEEVMERIEQNVNAVSTHWIRNEKQVRAALAFMLPGPDQIGGGPAYTMSKQSDGQFTFKLTPAGKKWLANRMLYSYPNGKKKSDPYGARQARQLYGRMVKGAKLKPKASQPRMAGGLR